ncbi:hypothetical protein BS47DRAFT_1368721 [Hydnum rufescens UP504]|uniref:Uncharacterized protein n=1 Tax=Hydnum rufescens UP504 TaxID=1448309 RepID=A0A9P6AF09_9AGAM|nr:hypothetical protein BS47DRAFT_1368721 [Hydnum rufescens UP504]
MSPDFLSCKFELTYYLQQNVTSQEPSYPQINIGRHKVDDEANNEVNDETANMEKLGPPGGNQRNKKFHVIASTPSQPPKNRAYIQLESHPKVPEVEYQHESWRSASLLNGTPTSSQVDYPDDPPLLPVQSSEPEHASSTFGNPHIPEACPGDLLYVWDATQVDTLLWSLPDQGADPSEDYEFIDCTLNCVFQGINVSHLAKEMRWGPCGALGIIEGLAFFANTHSLKLEQFEIKILKLVKALKKSSNPESQLSVLPLSGSRPSMNPTITSTRPSAPVPVPPIHRPKDQVLPSIQLPVTDAHTLPTLKSTQRKQLHVPFKVPYGKGKGVEAILEDEVESRDADLGSDIEADVSDIKDDNDINDTRLSSDGEGQPHQPQYNRGPFPTALVDELMLINPFHFLVSPGGLRLEYAKEKEWFNGDADSLEAWLDDLQSLAQQSKVDKDIQVTSGTKLTKYIHWKKKLLMGKIQHMATFDAHVVAFIVCSQPDAYAAHAQNAILFGSSEIQQLAKKQFNLKKSLEELFIKLMNEQLDATGISKWHEEAEKVRQEHELKTRDSAYSATSKYLRNLFISNGHAWFPGFHSLGLITCIALPASYSLHWVCHLKKNALLHIQAAPTRAGKVDSGDSLFPSSKRGIAAPLSLKDGARMMLMMTLLSHWSLTGMVMQSAVSKMQG